jgi:hypothetical protein
MCVAPLAYIDPGTGSLMLQALAGGAAAVAVFGKIYWRRVKSLLRIGRPKEEGRES